MKKQLVRLGALLLLFCLCACSAALPEPQPREMHGDDKAGFEIENSYQLLLLAARRGREAGSLRAEIASGERVEYLNRIGQGETAQAYGSDSLGAQLFLQDGIGQVAAPDKEGAWELSAAPIGEFGPYQRSELPFLLLEDSFLKKAVAADAPITWDSDLSQITARCPRAVWDRCAAAFYPATEEAEPEPEESEPAAEKEPVSVVFLIREGELCGMKAEAEGISVSYSDFGWAGEGMRLTLPEAFRAAPKE